MAVAERIARLARHLELMSDGVVGPLGLEQSEFDVIAALLRAGPPHELTPMTLNQSLMLSEDALFRLLDRLEERGLISAVFDADTSGPPLVAITEDGRSLAEIAVTAHAKATAELLAPLPVDRREALSALLRELLMDIEPPG